VCGTNTGAWPNVGVCVVSENGAEKYPDACAPAGPASATAAATPHTPVDVLHDTVAQFPTHTEAYLKAIEALAF
jgi:hypothetical protein